MPRIDYCDSRDHDAIDRLLVAIHQLGGTCDDDAEEPGIGAGLNRFHVSGEELTVYRDAFRVDCFASDGLIAQLVDLLQSSS